MGPRGGRCSDHVLAQARFTGLLRCMSNLVGGDVTAPGPCPCAGLLQACCGAKAQLHRSRLPHFFNNGPEAGMAWEHIKGRKLPSSGLLRDGGDWGQNPGGGQPGSRLGMGGEWRAHPPSGYLPVTKRCLPPSSCRVSTGPDETRLTTDVSQCGEEKCTQTRAASTHLLCTNTHRHFSSILFFPSNHPLLRQLRWRCVCTFEIDRQNCWWSNIFPNVLFSNGSWKVFAETFRAAVALECFKGCSIAGTFNGPTSFRTTCSNMVLGQ